MRHEHQGCETRKAEDGAAAAAGSGAVDGLSRRHLLGGMGGLALGGVAAGLEAQAAWAAPAAVTAAVAVPAAAGAVDPRTRAADACKVRAFVAERECRTGFPAHPTNGDDDRYASHIGSFTKSLPHDELGEVDPAAYGALRRALAAGDFAALDAVPMGGTVSYEDPIGGLTWHLAGADSAAVAAIPPPAIASREYATQLAELYWMAVLRDVPFLDYGTHPLVRQACDDLSRLSGDAGPRDAATGKVTPQTLFRAPYPGATDGPHISQFLLRGYRYDGIPIDPRISTCAPGNDRLTDLGDWLAAQNGFPKGVPAPIPRDATLRYPRSGRDLALLATQDFIYSLYFRALLVLAQSPWVASLAGNPYRAARREIGFCTFGMAHLASLVGGCNVANNAFYLKWYVHRYLRPEAGSGRVHFRKLGRRDYPIHDDLLSSPVLDLAFEGNHKQNRDRAQIDRGSYLLSQASAFGCPCHPSFVSVHATLAGACITILKAWVNESVPFPDPVQADASGTALIPYVPGKDGPPLTVGGELNKLCSNITFGRNILGVHYRSDSQEGNRVGEECALRALAEHQATLPMKFAGFQVTRFSGQAVEV